MRKWLLIIALLLPAPAWADNHVHRAEPGCNLELAVYYSNCAIDMISQCGVEDARRGHIVRYSHLGRAEYIVRGGWLFEKAIEPSGQSSSFRYLADPVTYVSAPGQQGGVQIPFLRQRFNARTDQINVTTDTGVAHFEIGPPETMTLAGQSLQVRKLTFETIMGSEFYGRGHRYYSLQDGAVVFYTTDVETRSARARLTFDPVKILRPGDPGFGVVEPASGCVQN